MIRHLLSDPLTSRMDEAIMGASDMESAEEAGLYYKDSVFTAMNSLRAVTDELEGIMDSELWPYPSYGELLFGVK